MHLKDIFCAFDKNTEHLCGANTGRRDGNPCDRSDRGATRDVSKFKMASSCPAFREDQVLLYKALRDGDVTVVDNLLPVACINTRPFEALWHAPGAEATCLHVAVCCLQVQMVQWLLDHGADPNMSGDGKSTLDMLTCYELFEGARVARPADVIAIRDLLTRSLQGTDQ